MTPTLPDSDSFRLSPHPWGRFLNARYDCILWLEKEMGYDDKTIAQNLSMDEIQVWLIKNSKHMPIPEGTYDPNTSR